MPLFSSRSPTPDLLERLGPRLPVRVSLVPAVATLRGSSAAVDVTALVDTGAGITCISPRVVEALQLKPTGTMECAGATGLSTLPTHVVRLEFIGSGIGVETMQVIEADASLVAQGIDMLIGRDILGGAAFTYDGPTGAWTLEIPRTAPPGTAPPAPPEPAQRPAPSTQDKAHAKAARKAQRKARKKARHH